MPITAKKWDTATNSHIPLICEDCSSRLTKPKLLYRLLINPCRVFPQGLVSNDDLQCSGL